ncbi:hypothetical protein [Candidatus Symbiobacter mobilis]|nr:hypothetical protein [Candidatus Symbiobacter mobilis]
MHRAADAPPKPPVGAPCNGCGVCCLLEPCPLGRLWARRRTGACPLLIWHPGDRQYRCGALVATPALLPRPVYQWMPWLAPLLRTLAQRWIAAGQGCDCNVEVYTAPPGKGLRLPD